MTDTDKKQSLRRARWLAGLAAGALLLPVTAHAETLQGALAKAYENNPTLTGARAGQRANDENVPIEKSYGLPDIGTQASRSEEHTSELPTLMRISYAVFCLKKKKILNTTSTHSPILLHQTPPCHHIMTTHNNSTHLHPTP